MKTSNKFKLGLKLLLLFMSTAFITGLIGFLGIQNMGKINQLISNIYNRNLVPVTYISETSTEVINHNRRLCIYVLLSERSEKKFFKQKMMESQENIKKSLALYRTTVSTDQEKVLLANLDHAWPEYIKNVDNTLQLSENGKNRDAENLAIGVTREKFQIVDDILTQLVNINKKQGQQAYKQSNLIYTHNRIYFMVLVLVCTGICLTVGLIITILIMTAYVDIK